MRPGSSQVDKIVSLAVTGSECKNVAVVIFWKEVSVAELQAEERITIEVTPKGEWNCGSLFEEFEGSAGSLDAGKLASAGALANLLVWFREWHAEGLDLLIIEVPEDDVITYVWHFERYSKRHKYGEEPTLEAAQAAAIQAVEAFKSMRGPMRSAKDPKNTVERLTNSLHFIAASVGTARERYQGAWSLLLPLSEDDFPEDEDKARIAKIHAAVPSDVPDSELGQRLADVWDLYWRMSSNQQYK